MITSKCQFRLPWILAHTIKGLKQRNIKVIKFNGKITKKELTRPRACGLCLTQIVRTISVINKSDHPKEILNRMTLTVIEKSNKCQILRKICKRQRKSNRQRTWEELVQDSNKMRGKLGRRQETTSSCGTCTTLSQWSIDFYVFVVILKFIETIYVISLKDIYLLCKRWYKCCHV